jgi:hypothetical protein
MFANVLMQYLHAMVFQTVYRDISPPSGSSLYLMRVAEFSKIMETIILSTHRFWKASKSDLI